MIDPARRTSMATPTTHPSATASREPTAQEFFAHLAADGALLVARAADTRSAEELSAGDLAAVARQAAFIFGDRPLGALTLGELAQLPAVLESRGMAPDASRVACRALGNALRSAILSMSHGRA